MARNRVFIIVLIVVVVAAGIAGAIALTSNKDTTDTTHTMPMTGNEQSSKSEQPVQTDTVTIKDYAYGPATISVKVGTTVTWTNQDTVGHTITADEPSSAAPDSQLLAKGESYSFTFTKAGTYGYHCQPHPYMKGTVIVTE